MSHPGTNSSPSSVAPSEARGLQGGCGACSLPARHPVWSLHTQGTVGQSGNTIVNKLFVNL